MHRIKSFLLILGVLLYGCILASVLLAAQGKQGSLELKSSAFQSGGDMPRKNTCDGNDVSPQLTWSNPPSGTHVFALIADDPDAVGGAWVHWVIYDLPADTKELAEGVPTTETLPSRAKQGTNDFRKIGYGGPCPPPGQQHRYAFKLYALDAATGLQPRATKQQLLKAIENHVLGEADLIGRYRR
jgi:Raf kinase inhibitor-like YbhB/YbcL family protein